MKLLKPGCNLIDLCLLRACFLLLTTPAAELVPELYQPLDEFQVIPLNLLRVLQEWNLVPDDVSFESPWRNFLSLHMLAVSNLLKLLPEPKCTSPHLLISLFQLSRHARVTTRRDLFHLFLFEYWDLCVL